MAKKTLELDGLLKSESPQAKLGKLTAKSRRQRSDPLKSESPLPSMG